MITIEELLKEEGIKPLERDMFDILREEDPGVFDRFSQAVYAHLREGGLERVTDIYNLIHDYGFVSLVESQRYEPLVQLTPIIEKNAVKGRHNVLELGAGFGFRLVYYSLNNQSTSFTALDVNPRNVEFASILARKHGCKNIKFEASNMEDMAYRAEFDSAIAADVLHESSIAINTGLHVICQDRYKEQLEKISLAIKIGGVVTITLSPVSEENKQREVIKEIAQQLGLQVCDDDKMLNTDFCFEGRIIEYMAFIKKVE